MLRGGRRARRLGACPLMPSMTHVSQSAPSDVIESTPSRAASVIANTRVRLAGHVQWCHSWPRSRRSDRSLRCFQHTFQAGPYGPLLASAHQGDHRSHQLEPAVRLEVPRPPHPGALGNRVESQITSDIHAGQACPRREAPGSLVGRPLNGHGHLSSHRPHLCLELRAQADRLGRDLLGVCHPWVVTWLVALIGAEVKHLLHRTLDGDLPGTTSGHSTRTMRTNGPFSEQCARIP
jgi:hypothetical protein